MISSFFKTTTASLTMAGMIFSASILSYVVPVSAAPVKMVSLETPMEGTIIYNMRIRSNGNGRIVLACFQKRCERDRIRLKINSDTVIKVNERPVNPVRFRSQSNDEIAAFYNEETQVLTRLEITR